jgi:hypothetical protein
MHARIVVFLGFATAGGLGVGNQALRARMRDHEAHGEAMHQAVVRSDLGVAKREARVLAEMRLGSGIEPTWRHKLEAMNGAAERVARARDLDEAAGGVGAVARTCGDCHASLGGPKAPAVGEAPPGEGSLTAQMARHAWAAARMWDGLVVPSDDTWLAGARALADAPLSPSRLPADQSRAMEIVNLVAATHELAREAAATGDQAARAALFGELTGTCAACHVKVRRPEDAPHL